MNLNYASIVKKEWFKRENSVGLVDVCATGYSRNDSENNAIIANYKPGTHSFGIRTLSPGDIDIAS